MRIVFDEPKGKVSNKMLVIIIANILWFTIVATVIEAIRGVPVSSALIVSWFAFWTAELAALTGIKISKVKKHGASEGKGKVSRRMLVTIVINITWFTIAVLCSAFFRSIEISPTLITCWYSFWGVELLALAGIKITKVRQGVQLPDTPEEEIIDE